MKLTFLGTGTSTGVPMIGCHCRTCSSLDPVDHRLRASVLIEREGSPALLIDAGPDLRTQLLYWKSPALAAVLITHIHYDHVGGLDDLRPYCYCRPDGRFPLFCRADVAKNLMHNIPYAFASDKYPGAPAFDLHIIEPGNPFIVSGFGVLPIEVVHGKLPILGYRIGDLAYITDASYISPNSLALLQGVKILVINALRPKPHAAHFSLKQALEVVAQVKPERAYLTHISHDMPPAAEVEPTLPSGVFLAHDNLKIEI